MRYTPAGMWPNRRALSEEEAEALRFGLSGDALRINFSTSAAGGVRVVLEQPDGTPIPGRSMEDALEQVGDATDHVVRWQDGSDVGQWAGTPVRLRFQLKDADLYSFVFERP